MIRRAFTMRLKPGGLEGYRARHDAIWPELVLGASFSRNALSIASASCRLAPSDGFTCRCTTGALSIGVRMQQARDLNEASLVICYIIVVLVIGIVVDSLLFGRLDRAIRHRWGLVDGAS